MYSSILREIEMLPDESKTELKPRLTELCGVHYDYLSHLLRTKHQGDYYKFVQKNLKPGECVIIIDYKMKLELGKRTREIQRDWYGKRGISLHGSYVFAKVTENEKNSEVLSSMNSSLLSRFLFSSFSSSIFAFFLHSSSSVIKYSMSSIVNPFGTLYMYYVLQAYVEGDHHCRSYSPCFLQVLSVPEDGNTSDHGLLYLRRQGISHNSLHHS